MPIRSFCRYVGVLLVWLTSLVAKLSQWWDAKRVPDRPSSKESVNRSFVIHSKHLAYLDQASRNPIKGYNLVVFGVPVLLLVGMPFAIFRRVTLGIVGSINRVSLWLLSHVLQKISKVSPSGTDAYSFPSVPRKILPVRICASLDHVFPTDVGGGLISTVTMTVLSVLCVRHNGISLCSVAGVRRQPALAANCFIRLMAICLVLFPRISQAQYQPYAVQFLQHAYNPCAGRQYLGVTNLYAGSNVLFTAVGNCDYRINVSVPSPMPPGASFWFADNTNIFWTNPPPAEVWIGDGTGNKKIQLRADGTSTFESNLVCKTTISTKDFTASGTIVGGPGAVFYGNGAGLTNVTAGVLTNSTVSITDSNATFGVSIDANAVINAYGGIDMQGNSLNGVVDINSAGIGTFNTVVALNPGGFVGDGSALTNIPCCTNGAYSGSFTGDGSGLTNLTFSTNASNSTNFWGSLSTTNLPSWIAYTPSNNVFTTSNTFNGQIVQTNSARTNTYLALDGQRTTAGNVIEYRTNNSVKFSVNSAGSVGVGQGATASASLDVIGGLKVSTSVLMVGSLSGSVGLTALSDGLLRINDNNGLGTAAGIQFGQVGNAGSTYILSTNYPAFMVSGYSNRVAMRIQAGTNSTGTLKTADLDITGSLNASNSVFGSNGLYYVAQSNSVVATNVIQPLHTWASMMGFVTNTINGGANTYAIVTNYSTARTNQMTCSLTAGTITNTIAGFYYCAIHMSMKSVDAGALVEGDLLLNGVERDEISFQTQFDPGTPRYKGASAFGILYIPSNTQITFQVKSSGANGIEIRRQQLVVFPP